MKFSPMKFVPQSVTRNVGRNVLAAKRNSPHIFFVGGVIGVVGSTVLACRATLKLEPVLDEIKNDLEKVKTTGLDAKAKNLDYTEREYIRDLSFVYGKSVGRIGRLYGPSVVLGVASVSALAGSHIQMTRRNAALTATLSAVTKAYDDYRIRVQEEIGKERELDIYRGMRDEEVKIDGEKKIIKVADPNKYSPYARIFDEYSNNWQKSAELNRIFIQCQQNYFNHRLHAIGHVFLNEVYDALGLERSHAGAVVGWLLNGENSDGHVDFGMFEAYDSRFVNNLERSIILDFNVDGVIYDKF